MEEEIIYNTVNRINDSLDLVSRFQHNGTVDRLTAAMGRPNARARLFMLKSSYWSRTSCSEDIMACSQCSAY